MELAARAPDSRPILDLTKRIVAMPEAVGNRLLGDVGESDGNCLIQGGEGADLKLAQALFDDEPTCLNGVEVRGVGWQVENAGSNCGDVCGDGCGDPRDFMGGQIVHHHDLSGAECRTEHFLQLREKNFAIGGTRYCHRGCPAFRANGSQHRYGLPAATWRALRYALSERGETVAPCPIRRDSTLIEKEKLLGSDASNLFASCSPFRLALDRVLLSGVQAFSSCGSPSRRQLGATTAVSLRIGLTQLRAQIVRICSRHLVYQAIARAT